MAGARSLFDQLVQIRASRTYDDAVSNISGDAESQVHLEGDLNVIRTILKAVKGTTNWFDDSTSDADLETLRSEMDAANIDVNDLQSFTGGADGESLPDFAATSYIVGMNLEAACAELDSKIVMSDVEKVGESISGDISAETDHTLPDGKTYTLDLNYQGQNLNVYMNGQLLMPDSSAILDDGDYEEVSTTEVKFHMIVEDGSNLIYEIRQ